MTARQGFSMIEMVVGLLAVSLFLYVAHSAIWVVRKQEKSADRDAARALREASVLEYLVEDVRSAAAPVESQGNDTWVIQRWFPAGKRLARRTVTWSRDPSRCLLRRQVDQDRPQVFPFAGLLGPGENQLVFHIKEGPDVPFAALPR